jgi:hypothetical protein
MPAPNSRRGRMVSEASSLPPIRSSFPREWYFDPGTDAGGLNPSGWTGRGERTATCEGSSEEKVHVKTRSLSAALAAPQVESARRSGRGISDDAKRSCTITFQSSHPVLTDLVPVRSSQTPRRLAFRSCTLRRRRCTRFGCSEGCPNRWRATRPSLPASASHCAPRVAQGQAHLRACQVGPR